MAYILLENASAGMDRRRERGAGKPGTLWLGQNVHVTRGGDVERRKKFMPEYDVAGTFGATGTGRLYRRANAASPAGVWTG